MICKLVVYYKFHLLRPHLKQSLYINVARKRETTRAFQNHLEIKWWSKIETAEKKKHKGLLFSRDTIKSRGELTESYEW